MDRILKEDMSISISTLKNSKNNSNKQSLSVYFKILLNYIQMISIIQTLDLQWPLSVQNYFNIYSNIGGASIHILSLDCLLQNYHIETEPIYIQTMFILSIPFIIFFGAIIIFAIISWIKKYVQKAHIVNTFIIISVFFQPSIIKLLFDNIDCEEIEDIEYLESNMKIECYSNYHIKWVISLFLFFHFIIYNFYLKLRQKQS